MKRVRRGLKGFTIAILRWFQHIFLVNYQMLINCLNTESLERSKQSENR